MATLDNVITDLHILYKAKPLRKLQPDNPDEAYETDHSPVLCEPLNNENISQPKVSYTKTIRPIKTDQLMEIGDWITKKKGGCYSCKRCKPQNRSL